jgi:hypothetical protein
MAEPTSEQLFEEAIQESNTQRENENAEPEVPKLDPVVQDELLQKEIVQALEQMREQEKQKEINVQTNVWRESEAKSTIDTLKETSDSTGQFTFKGKDDQPYYDKDAGQVLYKNKDADDWRGKNLTKEQLAAAEKAMQSKEGLRGFELGTNEALRFEERVQKLGGLGKYNEWASSVGDKGNYTSVKDAFIQHSKDVGQTTKDVLPATDVSNINFGRLSAPAPKENIQPIGDKVYALEKLSAGVGNPQNLPDGYYVRWNDGTRAKISADEFNKGIVREYTKADLDATGIKDEYSVNKLLGQRYDVQFGKPVLNAGMFMNVENSGLPEELQPGYRNKLADMVSVEKSQQMEIMGMSGLASVFGRQPYSGLNKKETNLLSPNTPEYSSSVISDKDYKYTSRGEMPPGKTINSLSDSQKQVYTDFWSNPSQFSKKNPLMQDIAYPKIYDGRLSGQFINAQTGTPFVPDNIELAKLSKEREDNVNAINSIVRQVELTNSLPPELKKEYDARVSLLKEQDINVKGYEKKVGEVQQAMDVLSAPIAVISLGGISGAVPKFVEKAAEKVAPRLVAGVKEVFSIGSQGKVLSEGASLIRQGLPTGMISNARTPLSQADMLFNTLEGTRPIAVIPNVNPNVGQQFALSEKYGYNVFFKPSGFVGEGAGTTFKPFSLARQATDAGYTLIDTTKGARALVDNPLLQISHLREGTFNFAPRGVLGQSNVFEIKPFSVPNLPFIKSAVIPDRTSELQRLSSANSDINISSPVKRLETNVPLYESSPLDSNFPKLNINRFSGGVGGETTGPIIKFGEQISVAPSQQNVGMLQNVLKQQQLVGQGVTESPNVLLKDFKLTPRTQLVGPGADTEYYTLYGNEGLFGGFGKGRNITPLKPVSSGGSGGRSIFSDYINNEMGQTLDSVLQSAQPFGAQNLNTQQGLLSPQVENLYGKQTTLLSPQINVGLPKKDINFVPGVNIPQPPSRYNPKINPMSPTAPNPTRISDIYSLGSVVPISTVLPSLIPNKVTNPSKVPVELRSPFEFINPFSTPAELPKPNNLPSPKPLPISLPMPLPTPDNLINPLPYPKPLPQLVKSYTNTPIINTPIIPIPIPNLPQSPYVPPRPPIQPPPPIKPIIPPIPPRIPGGNTGGFGSGGGSGSGFNKQGNRGIWNIKGFGVYAPDPLTGKVVGGVVGKKSVAYGDVVENSRTGNKQISKARVNTFSR